MPQANAGSVDERQTVDNTEKPPRNVRMNGL
jgi:hypothetical protein